MSGCKLASTPLAVGTRLTHSQSPTTPEEHASYAQSSNGIVYLEGIGSVLYITQTHPDIQHPVSILAQFSANPGKAHIKAFKRLLCYLKETAEFVLLPFSKHLAQPPQCNFLCTCLPPKYLDCFSTPAQRILLNL
jgi:hypothetical protein